MAENTEKDIPTSGDSKPIVRGALRLVPTPEVAAEPAPIDAAPNGMGRVDVAAMLLATEFSENDTDPVQGTAAGKGKGLQQDDALTEKLAAETVAEAFDNVAVTTEPDPDFEENEPAPAGVPTPRSDELAAGSMPEKFVELTYADGSTAPLPEKRGLLRKSRGRQQPTHDEQLQAVIDEAHATDVWAAHRTGEWHTEEPAMPPVPATPARGSGSRRRPLTVAGGIGAALVAVAAAVGILASSGGGQAAVHHPHATPKTQAVAQTTTATNATTAQHVTRVRLSEKALRAAAARRAAKRRAAARRAAARKAAQRRQAARNAAEAKKQEQEQTISSTTTATTTPAVASSTTLASIAPAASGGASTTGDQSSSNHSTASTEKSTSTTTTSKSASSSSSSTSGGYLPSGGLPDVQQTAQRP